MRARASAIIGRVWVDCYYRVASERDGLVIAINKANRVLVAEGFRCDADKEGTT